MKISTAVHIIYSVLITVAFFMTLGDLNRVTEKNNLCAADIGKYIVKSETYRSAIDDIITAEEAAKKSVQDDFYAKAAMKIKEADAIVVQQ
jgi:hypothetical protein